MRITAYEKCERDSLNEADAVIMDEAAYRQLGFLSGLANVVISTNGNYDAPGCFIRKDIGGAIRLVDSAGFRQVYVVGKSIYRIALIAYQAEVG